MDQFVFTLKDNNQKAFDCFFWFLFFLHLIAAAVIVLNTNSQQYKKYIFGSFILLLLFTVALYLLKNKFKLYGYQILVLATMLCFWLALSAWLPGIGLIFIIVFALVISKKRSIASFTTENIIITRSLFKKTYSWAAVQNAVLKDNLLSVDFKNNHLLQVELAADNIPIDENSFNQFCKLQLSPLIPNHPITSS